MLLPEDVSLINLAEVNSDFNARYSAKSRQYKYIFLKNYSALLRNRAWKIPFEVDFDKMKDASKMLIGNKDYRCFSKSDPEKENFMVNIIDINWIDEKDRVIFRIKANRFLRNMVRNIVGILVDIGRGRLTSEKMIELIEKKDRRNFGFCAPPQGLYLENVEY